MPMPMKSASSPGPGGVAERSPREGTDADGQGPARVTRRRFSAAYKRRVIEEARGAASQPGGVAALLRREGLYSSHLCIWRRQAVEPVSGRGPLHREELRRVLRENDRLRKRLAEAEIIIDVQKKLCVMFGLPTADDPPLGSPPRSARKRL